MASSGIPLSGICAAARHTSYREKGLAARFRARADVACTDLAQVVAVGRSDPAWGVRRDSGDSEGGRNHSNFKHYTNRNTLSQFAGCDVVKICSPWAVGVIVGSSRIERVANGQTLNPSMLTSLKISYKELKTVPNYLDW
uniref:Uncharacterized protein n=1 Tax=Oryza nivara TaxID=4536 RepID=A0A0E0GWA0_ORYNI